MSAAPACLPYAMENTRPDGTLHVCADQGHQGHEWSTGAGIESADESIRRVVKDANGNAPSDEDAVAVAPIKDLRVDGSSIALKTGTKAKGIRIVCGNHGFGCKTDAGSFVLTAGILRKVRRRALTEGEPACRCQSLHAPTPTICLPGSIGHGAG